jgi:hypothetical protein
MWGSLAALVVDPAVLRRQEVSRLSTPPELSGGERVWSKVEILDPGRYLSNRQKNDSDDA